MNFRAFVLGFAVASVLCAGPKKVISPDTSAGNEQLDIVATIVLDESEITQKLGADPGKGIALLQVKLIPKSDKAVQISPDDFILLAHDDGERSKPFEPAEIAGNGALVITATQQAQKKSSSSIGLGGMMMGGGSGASPGNSKVVTLNSKMDNKSQGNQTLLEALKAKELPETETVKPVEGYLYFPLDGKHKLKDLAVLYRGPAGRLNLEFEH